MQKKSIETILYSAAGVVIMLAILVALNFIAGFGRARLDLTQEHAFTLSPGTRAILQKLETPVTIRFYCTQGDSPPPETVYLKTYAKRVEDLLAEYKQAAKGKLVVELKDPEPDSDAEDSAKLDGVEGQTLRNGEPFYLGLAVSVLDEKQALPFLDPGRERLLEYDLSRAISRVANPEKPVIGIMTPLPVFGAPSNPMMMQMGQQGQQPWAFVTELQNDFQVKPVPMDAAKIDDDIKVLMVVHPREVSDKAQYAIDQFVLRGGKLVAFLDPVSISDSRQENPMLGNVPNTGSSLDKLLKAWGLAFDITKVVADMNFKVQLGGRNNQPQEAPAFLAITADGLNQQDILTSQIDSVWMPFAGAFTGTPAEGLKETVLIHSTKQSELVEGFMANLSGENILKNFKPSGAEYALAIRLNGKFKTAFPTGKPEEKSEADVKDGDKKADEKSAATKPDDSLKESKAENTVVLIGDADLLNDRVAFQRVQTLFGVALTPANGNLSFAQNTIEQMAGDSNLIAVRSRATLSRPFTRVKAMETAANEKYQSEIKRLEASAAEAQQKINELQQAKKDKDQRFVLSPEQNAELVKLRQQEVETRKHLKQVQKDFRKEVVSLQDWLKWVNVLAVPAAVTLSGLLIAIVNRRKTSAK
jgi:ABC-type uncharacterized transport system involved in gliding motility auxiliary subunit